MRRIISGWALAALVACSSTSTNEGSGGGGGGVATDCGDAGSECFACCAEPNDEGDGAYRWAQTQCVACEAGSSPCSAECCGDSVDLAACSKCVENADSVTACVSATCSGKANCKRFRSCLTSCL